MTPFGWFLMLASWACILSMFVYCLYRVMATHTDGKRVDEEH